MLVNISKIYIMKLANGNIGINPKGSDDVTVIIKLIHALTVNIVAYVILMSSIMNIL